MEWKNFKNQKPCKRKYEIKDDIKVTENENAIQKELIYNIMKMEIGFEKVMLPEDTK